MFREWAILAAVIAVVVAGLYAFAPEARRECGMQISIPSAWRSDC